MLLEFEKNITQITTFIIETLVDFLGSFIQLWKSFWAEFRQIHWYSLL